MAFVPAPFIGHAITIAPANRAPALALLRDARPTNVIEGWLQ